jgi:hypothetical protein
MKNSLIDGDVQEVAEVYRPAPSAFNPAAQGFVIAEMLSAV